MLLIHQINGVEIQFDFVFSIFTPEGLLELDNSSFATIFFTPSVAPLIFVRFFIA